jgi:hypothetical protein
MPGRAWSGTWATKMVCLAPDRADAAVARRAADWAGHSVEVLLRIYAKCVVGQDELAKHRISEALRQD